MTTQRERLLTKYGVESKPCPDCGLDPAPLDEGPMENPGAAAADHRAPKMALFCAECKEILATRYGYGKGAVPHVGV